jgi:hypothetical protein
MQNTDGRVFLYKIELFEELVVLDLYIHNSLSIPDAVSCMTKRCSRGGVSKLPQGGMPVTTLITELELNHICQRSPQS